MNEDLLQALKRCDFEKVKDLIKKGADVNSKSKTGVTPLQRFCSKGHIDDVKFLVEQGADIHARDDSGETPLHWAILGDLDVVKFLIENGADVNAKDGMDLTPLYWAVVNHKLEIAEYLRSKGAVW